MAPMKKEPELTEEEFMAAVKEHNLYYETPNPFNQKTGVFIILILKETTDTSDFNDVFRDAVDGIKRRLMYQRLKNLDSLLPGERALCIKYKPDSPYNEYKRPAPVLLFNLVREKIEDLRYEVGLEMKYKWPFDRAGLEIDLCENK